MKLKTWNVLMVLLFIGWSAQAQHSRIFPQPQSYIANGEQFNVGPDLILQDTPESREMLPFLKEQFYNQFGIYLLIDQKREPEIQLSVSKAIRKGYYHMTITSSGVIIEYNDYQGLFYAMQSLLQQTADKNTIHGANIEDWPAFDYRGVHLDCARHFFTIKELEQFIDEMARLKFNTFHWHLTDDQGWRIEIKKYPKLTEVGAWRDSTLIGHYSNQPQQYEHQRYGGFYTQEEAKKLVEYAKKRGIEVVPEIEMPGHARAALAAYPELGCTGEQLPVEGLWGVFDDVFCTKEPTVQFLKDVLDEVIAIFPSETIHVGGDETPKVRWKECTECQKNIKDHHLHDEHELQSYVIQQLALHLQAKGRKLMGWDEILEGGLAPSAQVMSWRGTEGGIAAAKAGHEVVMTPTAYCYFDYYQSGNPDEPLAIGGYLPLEKVYSFNPVPKELTEAEAKYILGGQANLWTEYLQTMKDVQYNAFPRLAAMSEVLWSGEKTKTSYDAFADALVVYQFPYYEKRGINYSSAAFEPFLKFKSVPNGVYVSAGCSVANTKTSIFNVGGIERTNRVINELEGDALVTVSEYKESDDSQITFFATPHSHKIDFTVATEKNGSQLRENHYTITTHMALGKPISFITPPSEKYNNHGNLGLTDGISGAKPWKGDQWLGFETDTVSFVIDLGKKTRFNKIQLGTLHDPGSWIYAPLTCLFETSKNGKDWKPICYRGNEAGNVGFINEGKVKTRYIRFTLENVETIPDGQPGAGFTPWTFIDELIITK